MMNTSTSTTSSTTAGDNVNGKRDRPAAATAITAASHGTSEPPAKQFKFPEGFLSHVQQAGATPEASKFAVSYGGTQCYAIVMSEPDGKTHVLEGGAQFKVTKTRCLLGMIDVVNNIDVDEASREAIFHIPDPDELKAACEKRKASGGIGFVKVDKYEDHRMPLDQPHKVDVHGMTKLPGVQWPSVVRIEGLICKGKRGKAPVDKDGNPRLDDRGNPIPSRIWYSLNSENICPLECLGNDPSLISRYIRECGAMTTWHREAPFATEEELKRQSPAGDMPLIMPIVRIDDPEAFGEHFNCSKDRGFQATIRPEAMLSSANFFYLSKPTKNELKAELKKQGRPESDLPNPKHVDLDNCDQFSICATWPVVVMQWDRSKHPKMSRGTPKKYEFQVSAYGTSLWSAGLSHPTHWAIFRYHIPFIGGVLMCQENRAGTCKVAHNIQRHKMMSHYAAEDPHSIGAGLEDFVNQYPKMWSRGVIMDVPSYLRKYALRCSFKTAAVLMGHPAKDCDDKSRPLRIFGQYGVETMIKTSGKAEEERKVDLNFNPDGFICLNSVDKQTPLRQLNEQIDQYYVLTSMTPMIERIDTPDGGSMLSAMLNAKRQIDLVSQIGDQEVLEICQKACLSEAEKSAMIAKSQKPDASPSLRAAGEWLRSSIMGVTSAQPVERPPFLVFGTYKQPTGVEKQRLDAAFATAVQGWTKGPSGVMIPPVRRINAPAQDELDLKPEPAAADGDAADSGGDDDERSVGSRNQSLHDDDGGSSGTEGEDGDEDGDANMIQATLDYEDDV